MAKETEIKATGAAETVPVEESLIDETEVPTRPRWREIFRQAFDKARREQRVTNRRDLGRDRSRSLFLLAGAAIAVLLLFLGVFSSSNNAKKATDGRRPGTPDLGRRLTPSQQSTGQTGSVTPLLSAQTGQPEAQGSQDVTAEDVGRTARPTQPSIGAQPNPATTPAPRNAGPYTLEKIDFSDTATRQEAPGASTSRAQSTSDDLRKPSLVFVRSVQSNAASANTRSASAAVEESPIMLELPAGAKAIGSLQQVDRSGYVAIHFDTIQMPDGTTEKVDATAMSLTYGPLKGDIRGKRTGTRFLVRTFTGLGTVATYLVGAGGNNGLNGPLSESALLRDRIATNIGIAGDQELNNLAFNQNIVVTVPGNTRFYLIVEKGATVHDGEARPATTQQVNNTQLPTVQELRELMQLRRELSEMAQQSSTQSSAQQVSVPQQ